MNILAHIYLSGENDQVKVGNFIGDWVKGNDHKKYPADIQKGILVHRFIDSFTDNHAIVRQSKMRFNDQYHKYSGVIVDIIFDHFLADNWSIYSQVDLATFTNNLNNCLTANMHYLPANIQEFIPRFMKRKWLESYATLEGIELVIQGMSKHTSLPDKTIDAIYILKNQYNTFAGEFCEFFPLLIANVEARFGIVITQLPK